MSGRTPPVNFSNLFIRAGAGAGKTTRLISTFMDFVDRYKTEHQKYPRIVITTFTRKATQEVRERLLLKALEKNDPDTFQYINKKSAVHISTIHGVLGLFINQFYEHLGLSSDIRILDHAQLKRKNFRDLKNIFKSSPQFFALLDHYSFSQVLEHLEDAYDGLNEHPNMLPLSKKDHLALREQQISEIIEVLQNVLSEPIPAGKGWPEYFDFLDKLLQKMSSPLEQVLDLWENKPKKPNFYKNRPAFSPDLHEKLVDYVHDKEGILKSLDSDSDIEQTVLVSELFFQLLKEFSEKIKSRQTQSSEMSIADLETLSLQILRSKPETASQFAEQFDFFMVDEFQDTSPLQVKILNQFLQYRPHFIVGDPQQSIYLFRGARSEVFLQKHEETLKGGYDHLQLQTNYRTRPVLMNFINDFFTEFSAHFQKMQTHPEPQKFSNNEQLHDVYFIKSQDQLLATLNQIQRLLSSGVKANDICVLSHKNTVLMDLAHQAATYNVPVQLMVAAGFDSRREILDLVSFLKFLVNPFDNENLLILIRGPWFSMTDAEIVELRQSNQQHFWEQLRTAAQTNAHASSAFNSSTSVRNDFLLLENSLRTYQSEGVLQSLTQFILNQNFLNSSVFLDPSGKREANIWKFVRSLRDQINSKNFNLNEYLSFQFSQLQSDLGSSLGEAQPAIAPDRVNLMTIHTAKGLEFKHVIVLGFSGQPNTTKVMPMAFDPISEKISLGYFNTEDSKIKNSFWSQSVRRQFNEREMAESERVLYVAMTRAIESLSLIAEIKLKTSKSKTENSEEETSKTTKSKALKSVVENSSAELSEASVSKNSWLAKSSWPEPGEFEKNGYHVHSFKDDKTPQVLERIHLDEKIDNVKPYSVLQSQKIKKTAITEIVSAGVNAEGALKTSNEVKFNSLNSGSNSKTISSDMLFNLKKAQSGTRLHKYFEALKYKDMKYQDLNERDRSDEGSLLNIFSESDIASDSTHNEKKYFEYLLRQKDLPLAEILKNGYVEWGFGLRLPQVTPQQEKSILSELPLEPSRKTPLFDVSVRLQINSSSDDLPDSMTRSQSGVVVQGQIDAWGKVGSTAYILDYKTGSSRYVEKAYEQLNFYAQCLKQMKMLEDCKEVILAVIYPAEEKIFQKNADLSN